MPSLSARARRTIRLRGLLTDDDRVAVALSGGSDSVALAWLLKDLASRARWSLAGLVHLNHGLRGAESEGDERFCRDLAERLKLPIEIGRVDAGRLVRGGGRSIEAAARAERYAWFESAARVLGATRVATGHTQDDQAETVLLRLLRGAGSRGLSAIRPRRGIYVRPLIDIRRAELRDELRRRGEPFRDDSSNLDLQIPRNRLRHEILPLIALHWPGAVVALARFAELAADDDRFLAETARQVSSAVTLPSAGGVQQVDVRGLSKLPAALARRIVRQAVETVGGAPSFREIEAVRVLAGADKREGHLDLAGLAVERKGPLLRFGVQPSGSAQDGAFEYCLAVPGLVAVPETGTTIRASLKRGGAIRHGRGEPVSLAVLREDAVAAPLVVRNRRPGDRLRPFGAPGSRKLQDVFVDHKVPREARDRVPIVVDRMGRILWVVGLTIAEECRVTTPESGVVILESKKGNQ
jgi:tRNA(Ile)-lysidine synthase